MKQVVKSTDLSSDFGLTSNNKLFNTNTIGASGTPNNTTVPPVIEKIWFWVDTTQNQITHFWKPSTSTWISLKDFTERSINLNNVTPAFTPNDVLQPTTTEVESWVNANLIGNDKVNGTLITWYIPTNYSFNSSAILELTNSGTTGFINSFKVNGVNILSTPIDISVTNYWLNLITIFDNYISSIGKTGTMADEGDPVSNYYFPINDLNFVCYLEIDYIFDSVTGTDIGNNILATYPSIGDIKNPTHIWILDLEGIIKVSSETPFVKTGFNTSTSLIDVKQTDSLYRKGKLNLGESFANLPEDVNHYLQIAGNTFENGRLRTTKGFYSDTPNYSITVDVVNGDDNLNIMLYPNSSFKTITKALEFATKIVSNFIYIDVINTTSTNKATLSGFNLLFSRNIGIGNNAGIMQYVDFSGSFLFYNGTLNFTKLNVVCANNTAIQLFNSTLITNSTNITLSPNRLQGTIQLRMGSDMQLHDSAGSSIIFSANNQAIFDNYAGEINEFLIDGGSSVINTGSFTGCKLFSGNHTNFSAIVKIEGGASLPTTLDLTNCIIYHKGNIINNITQWDSNYVNYSAVLGKTTPLLLKDINSAAEQTTATKNLSIDSAGVVGWKTDGTIALKTVNRAFSKVGSGQATNSDAVSISDAIYHSGNTTIGTTTNVAKLDVYQDLGGNNINPIVAFRDLVNRVSIYQRLTLGAYSQSVLAGDTAILSDENLANNNGLVVGKHNGATIRFGTSNAKGLGLFARNIATPDMFIDANGNVGIGTTSPSYKFEMVGGSFSLKSAIGNTHGFRIDNDIITDVVSLTNYFNAALTFGTHNIERFRVSNIGNVLIKKTTDSGLGDLQVPQISLGYNTWHNSEDGVERMYFGQNSTTYLSAPTGFPITFKINNEYRYRFYNDGFNIYNDGLTDITFAKSTLPLSSTVRDFILRKEANNQDYRFFDWDGTTGTDWWNVYTQTNKLVLGQIIWANYGNNVGIGTSTPDANTILDIVSTTKGSRPFPSMTQAQRTALTAPTGTHVYQTDGTEGVYVKKSSGWIFAY